MSTLISETLLPNGMKISSRVQDDVPALYEDVQKYFKNGIELQEGDTVFDVGANIGLFTLWVSQLYNKNVNVYAFEPIPATFEVLHRNVQHFDPEKLRVFNCGLSQESRMTTFAYCPNGTVFSNAYPDDFKDQRDQVKKAILHNLKDAPSSVRRLRWVPPFLRPLIVDHELEKLFQTELIACKMRTISDIVREYNIERIDLLKVDAEKSELDVLLGIEEEDWLKIKQVVAEVHDVDGRVEKLTELLKKHRLSEITVEQEPFFKGTNVFNLYALRPKAE